MWGYGLLLIAVLAGCDGSQPPRLTPDTAAYTLGDTAQYGNAIGSSHYAVLRRDGRILDSIDLFFGIQRLNTGSVVFLPVEPYDPQGELLDEGVSPMEIGKHVIYDRARRRRITLASFLPHFDDYFSSPAVWGGVLYYWGVERSSVTDLRKLHAVRYDAAARRIDSRFLFESEMATDNRAYLAPPEPVAGMIRFETFDNTLFISPDLRSAEPIPPALAELLRSAPDSARAKAEGRASLPRTPASRQP